MGFELLNCYFLETGIKIKIVAWYLAILLTFPFLEKHVSPNYNPCWYQNVCSLNIYQPRVTSKAEHRHLETSFFPPQVLCPKGNAVKALQTIWQVSKLSTRCIPPTTQTALRKQKKKNLPPTNCTSWNCTCVREEENSCGYMHAVLMPKRVVQKYYCNW